MNQDLNADNKRSVYDDFGGITSNMQNPVFKGDPPVSMPEKDKTRVTMRSKPLSKHGSRWRIERRITDRHSDINNTYI